MFKVDEHVIYPGHGVGRVTAIEVKQIFGNKIEFVKILLNSGMTILAPSDKTGEVGIRAIADSKTAKRALGLVTVAPKAVPAATWNRRYREYMEKVNAGDLLELAKLYAILSHRKNTEELSFGERKLFETVHTLISQEIGLALGLSDDETNGLLNVGR